MIDAGALESDIYNAHGDTWEPNFDLVVWSWTGWIDPGPTLSILTTRRSVLNDPYWSNAPYDKLAVQQECTVDPQQRQAIVWQMQQVIYEQSPSIALTYPDILEAFNTAKWTGWTQEFGGTGPAWRLEGDTPPTSILLRPATLASTGSGSSNTVLIAVVAVVVIVVAGIAFVFLREAPASRR